MALTPDRPYWYDRMIDKGFAERDEAYSTIYQNGNPSEIFKQTLLDVGTPSSRLLDVGSGPGKYAEMYAPGYASLIALDLSANSLAYGRKHHKGPNMEFVLGDARDLPFDQEAFDVVSSRLSPHDLNEMMRVLKPGGMGIVMRVGETDALELRRLFGQAHIVDKMDAYIARGEPHSRHIVEEWKAAGFMGVEVTEHEYDMHFLSVEDLAKYLSRIPIIPEFDMTDPEHMQKLQQYADQSVDPETHAVVLHRHRNLIKGFKE